MKAILPFSLSPHLLSIVRRQVPESLEITVLPARDPGIAEASRDADVMLHVLEPVTASVIDSMPKLKLIQKVGIGVDTIDLAHAGAKGIPVCNMPGTNTQAVAELTLALMFACVRQIPAISTATRGGRGWSLSSEQHDRLGEISGRTVGLIGYGAVSRRLVPVLNALGARVIAASRTSRDDAVEFMPLDTLLAESDILSLHLPLTPETDKLLDAKRLAACKPGAILINTARGALVDEAALVDALDSGHIASAGLDVFRIEPQPADSPLLNNERVVATPHIAWLTDGTWRRSAEIIAENCRRMAAGEDLLHRVA